MSHPAVPRRIFASSDIFKPVSWEAEISFPPMTLVVAVVAVFQQFPVVLSVCGTRTS